MDVSGKRYIACFKPANIPDETLSTSGWR